MEPRKVGSSINHSILSGVAEFLAASSVGEKSKRAWRLEGEVWVLGGTSVNNMNRECYSLQVTNRKIAFSARGEGLG